jgi:hypothetical protein
LSESVYEIRIPFESQNALITYSNNSYSNTAVATGDFVKRYTVEGFLALLNWKLQINDNPACIKAMSILYRLVILMELQGIKG